MTDEEKLRITKDAFMEKLMGINSWDDFKAMLIQLTKEKVKAFIKTNLQNAVQNQTNTAAYSTNMATEINALITEVNNI